MKVTAYITPQTALAIERGENKPMRVSPNRNLVSCIEITFVIPKHLRELLEQGMKK